LFLVTVLFSNINTILITVKIIKLDAIDSTNDYLKAWNKKIDLDDQLLVVAKDQTKGRGHVGSKWHAEIGKSLNFSILRRFNKLAIAHQFAINCAVSLGIKKGLEKNGIRNVRIKWPNDILADDKKLCGILIENQLQAGNIGSSIIGVGVNVNNRNFPNLPQASSMFLIKNKVFDLDRVLLVVSDSISSELERVENRDFEDLKSEYEQHLFRKDIISVFENSKNERFNGIIKGISRTGKLCLEMENESLMYFNLKDLQLLY
jgi:BirA family transcriptional regulator, biotin operon repressor / biotin---[acetyl-CoA-carboxylase] ligase